MKKYLHMVVCLTVLMCLLLGLIGCKAEEENKPVEDTVTGNELVLEKVHEVPSFNQYIGLWSSGENEEEPLRLCFFENGSAFRFGRQTIGLGTWSVAESGQLSARFEYCYTADPELTWKMEAKGELPSLLLANLDGEVFLVSDYSTQGIYKEAKRYYPVNKGDDYTACLEQLDAYYGEDMGAWLLIDGANQMRKVVVPIYSGLELLMYRRLVEALPETEKALLTNQEVTWYEKKQERVEIAPFGEREDIACSRERIEELLSWMRGEIPVYPLPEDALIV